MSFLTPDERAALEAALPAWLPQQRWFATKNSALLGVQIVTALELDKAHGLAFVHVERPGGVDLYSLPLARTGAQPIGETALVDGAASAAWWMAFAACWPRENGNEQRRCATPFDLRFHVLDGSCDGPNWSLADVVSDAHEVRIVGADASNASALLCVTALRGGRPFARPPVPGTEADAWLFAKVIRRVPEEPSPELDRLGVLDQDIPDFVGHAPALMGTATLGLASSALHRRVVALLTSGYSDAQDAWAVMLGALERRDEAQVVELAHRLGDRLAALHQALATASSAKGRTPHQGGYPVGITSESVRQTLRQLRATWRSLHGLPELKPTDNGHAALQAFAAMAATPEMLPDLPPEAALGERTWIHGDLHLGQVLVLRDGTVRFVDFEGEPARTPRERAAPDSPLRDVAGMLRSFDYAVCTALPEQERDGMRTASERAFLHAYRQRIAADRTWLETPDPTGAEKHLDLQWPDDRAFEPLLRLYLLQKTLYEVQYERAYRPDWAWIPEQALERLLGAT